MSDKELESLREAYRDAVATDDIIEPTDDELAMLVTGEIQGADRDALVQRMLRSPDAVRRHKILKELHAEAGARKAKSRSWYRPVAAAAVVLLAVSLWQLNPADLGDTRRSGNDNVFPSDNILLESPPTSFQWQEAVGARRYRLTLYDNEGIQVWQSEWTSGTEISDHPVDVLDGGRHYWTVEIDGASARRSLGPFWFRIE